VRDVSSEFLSAAAGSNTPLVSADVWLGPDVIREAVFVVGGRVEWNAENAVEGLATLTLLDTKVEGSRLSDIIHSYGCRLNLRAGFSLSTEDELVSLGWFDIVSTDAVEDWRWYDWRDEAVKLSEVVHVRAEGLMSLVAGSELFAPTQPTPGSDAWAAIVALCLDIVSTQDPDLAAKALPTGASAVVFDKDRLQPIQQIAALWDAKPVITDEGQLTLAVAGAGPEVDGYGYDVNIESWRNQTSKANLWNGVAFHGRSPAGLELVGYATEESGPLAWGGPFGRRPRHERSDLMTTQAMVDEAAVTTLARLKSERSATQTVQALWNPAQQIRDRPTLAIPGRDPVESEIVAIVLPFGTPPNGGGPMSVTLKLPLLLEG
jgi:hypothetical protein